MAKSVSVEAFSVQHRIPFRALYYQFIAEKDPKLSTLLAIQKATKRAVTVQDIATWWENRK